MEEELKKNVIAEDVFRGIADLLNIPPEEVQRELEKHPELIAQIREHGVDSFFERLQARVNQHKKDAGELSGADPYTLLPSVFKDMATRTPKFFESAAKRGVQLAESLPKFMFRFFLAKLGGALAWAVSGAVLVVILIFVIKYAFTEYYCAGIVWLGDSNDYKFCYDIRYPSSLPEPPNEEPG